MQCIEQLIENMLAFIGIPPFEMRQNKAPGLRVALFHDLLSNFPWSLFSRLIGWRLFHGRMEGNFTSPLLTQLAAWPESYKTLLGLGWP